MTVTHYGHARTVPLCGAGPGPLTCALIHDHVTCRNCVRSLVRSGQLPPDDPRLQKGARATARQDG